MPERELKADVHNDVRLNRQQRNIAIVALIVSLVFGVLALNNPLAAKPTTYTYSAQIPGPGCDTGKAIWDQSQNTGEKLCDGDRMTLKTNIASGIGEVFFYGTQQLPKDNKVTVLISGLSQGSCAGITTRNSRARKGSYAFQICQDGSWIIAKYDENDKPSNLIPLQHIPPQNAYKLTATADGVSLRLAINDTNLQPVAADGSFSDTDAISLFVAPGISGTGSAEFQSFTFEQLN